MKLIRRIIQLKATTNIELPYDYHYELMKKIYEVFTLSNEELAIKIHAEGYKADEKIYKLFNHEFFAYGAEYKEDNIKVKKDSSCILVISGEQKNVDSIVLGFLQKETFFQ